MTGGERSTDIVRRKVLDVTLRADDRQSQMLPDKKMKIFFLSTLYQQQPPQQ